MFYNFNTGCNKHKLNYYVCSSFQSSQSVDPDAAEIPQEEHGEEAEEQAEEDVREERERVHALVQRKKMLEDLEVVDLIQKLLQSQKKGGGIPEGSEKACSQQKDQRREQATVRLQRCQTESQLSFWLIRFFISAGFFNIISTKTATICSDLTKGNCTSNKSKSFW